MTRKDCIQIIVTFKGKKACELEGLERSLKVIQRANNYYNKLQEKRKKG